MDIRQLNYFLTVCEEGSISAAARKLHISQPPLSEQIRLLEAEHGVRLFERGARRITMTDAGRTLARYAREILELRRSASEELKNFGLGRQGSVRLGMISSCGCDRLYACLREFAARSPGVSFKVFEGNTFELLEFLEGGRIDLAAIRTPFPAHGLDLLKVQADPLVAAARAEFFKSIEPDEAQDDAKNAFSAEQSGQTSPLALSQLAGAPLIVYRRWEELITEAFAARGLTPEMFVVCDDARTALRWAEAGLGCALMPMPASGAERLELRELDADELKSTICLARRRGAHRSPSSDALFDLAAELFK